MNAHDENDRRWSIVGATMTICSMTILLVDRDPGPTLRFVTSALIVTGLIIINIRLFMTRKH